jgi:hypothetical protein
MFGVVRWTFLSNFKGSPFFSLGALETAVP